MNQPIRLHKGHKCAVKLKMSQLLLKTQAQGLGSWYRVRVLGAPAIGTTLPERLRREAAEDDRVQRPQPRARQHRDCAHHSAQA